MMDPLVVQIALGFLGVLALGLLFFAFVVLQIGEPADDRPGPPGEWL